MVTRHCWRVATILAAITGALAVLWPTLVASQSQPAPVPQADRWTGRAGRHGACHARRPGARDDQPGTEVHLAAAAF
jgi:hypothetical protein